MSFKETAPEWRDYRAIRSRMNAQSIRKADKVLPHIEYDANNRKIDLYEALNDDHIYCEFGENIEQYFKDGVEFCTYSCGDSQRFSSTDFNADKTADWLAELYKKKVNISVEGDYHFTLYACYDEYLEDDECEYLDVTFHIIDMSSYFDYHNDDDYERYKANMIVRKSDKSRVRKSKVRKYYTEEAHEQAAKKFIDEVSMAVREKAEHLDIFGGLGFGWDDSYYETVTMSTDEIGGDWKAIANLKRIAREVIESLGGDAKDIDMYASENDGDYMRGIFKIRATVPDSFYEGIETANHPLAGYESPYIKEFEYILYNCGEFENITIEQDATTEPDHENRFYRSWNATYKGKVFGFDVVDISQADYHLTNTFCVSLDDGGLMFKWWYDVIPTADELIDAIQNRLNS